MCVRKRDRGGETERRGGQRAYSFIDLEKRSRWYHRRQKCDSDGSLEIRGAGMCFEGHRLQSSHRMKKKSHRGD